MNNLFSSIRFSCGRTKPKPKIFYVSLQRCGTKSFSEFFKRNGYSIASWKTSRQNGWPAASLDGRYQDILKSKDFRDNTVFEDGPWNHIALIKYLYWAEPNSRFVYFSRPVDDWLKSLKSHSSGRGPGNPKRHSIIYERLEDYYDFVDAGIERPELNISDDEAHYAYVFRNHWLQLRAFFEDKPSDRFFHGHLYDKDKWRKLSDSWNMDFQSLQDVHIHKSGFPKMMNHSEK